MRAVIVSSNETPGDRGVTRNGLPNADDDPPRSRMGGAREPLLGDAVLDDSFASGVAFVVSKSKDERLIERRRCVLEPEAEDLVGVATFERVQRFAEPHLGSVEMGAEGREQLFAAVHGGERYLHDWRTSQGAPGPERRFRTVPIAGSVHVLPQTFCVLRVAATCARSADL